MTAWTLVVPRREVERTPAARVFGRPHPSLAGHVLSYTAHDFPRSEPAPWRVAPLGVVTVTVDLDAPVRRLLAPDPRAGQDVPGSPVTGLRDRPWTIEQAGPSRGIVIALTPPAAYTVFGLPLRELANTSLGLGDLLGADAELLREQLAESADPFRVLDRFLANRLRHGPRMATPVAGSWTAVTAARGRLRIDALAGETGWTRRHLGVRFREQVGLSPKTVARIARLHHAAALLSGPTPRPRSEVASICGFADQAHLGRDFRALTGCTPTDYVGA